MYEVQSVTLDVRARYADIYLDATQFDTGRVFKINLIENGIVLNTVGQTVSFTVGLSSETKTATTIQNTSDGIYIEFDDSLTIDNGKFDYELVVGTTTILGVVFITKFLVDYDLLSDGVAGAKADAERAKSFAVGDTGTRLGEDTDNAMYYYNLIKQDTFGICYVDDIGFAELTECPKHTNYMYKILNEFTSNNSFVDGGGVRYPAGSYVYYTENGKWDCFIGAGVIGVLGENNSRSRIGNVSLDRYDFGLPNAVNVRKSSSTPSDQSEYWMEPYGSGDGYQPYKFRYYHQNTDSYKLISPYAVAATVERPNGENSEAELMRIEERIDNLIDDNDIASDKTWSSEKISEKVGSLPQIDDSTISKNTVWSSEKTSKYKQFYKTIPAHTTENIDLFEGMFAIVRASVSSTGVIGVLDRWAGIIYVTNAGSSFATITVNDDIVSVSNNTETPIQMYWFTTYHFG